MWQRFTERARKVVFYAQEEAQKFGEGYVSTEHLLLGLIRESDSVAARILEHKGISLNRIRAEVERQLPRGDARPSQDMTLTPRAKRVIDLAYDEARNANNNYIGTEHLLLGLIREAEGLAGRVLSKLGAELQPMREIMMRFQTPPVSNNPAIPKVVQERIQLPAAGWGARCVLEKDDGEDRVYGLRFFAIQRHDRRGKKDTHWNFLTKGGPLATIGGLSALELEEYRRVIRHAGGVVSGVPYTEPHPRSLERFAAQFEIK